MEEQESQKKKNLINPGNKGLRDFGKYSGLAFEMIAIILLATLGGVKLDEHTGWKIPVFTIIFSLSGVFIALYISLKDFIRK